MTTEAQSFLRGYGHRAMAYTQLYENPEGETGKGVLTGGVILRRRVGRWGGDVGEGPTEWLRRSEK
jgi:hypothetical protein